jgi:hypothetical protein
LISFIIEEDKKRFEIKMGIKLGRERGNVVFDVNKKRLNLKDRDNQFYILNDDLVDNSIEISNISFTQKDFKEVAKSIRKL